MHPLFGPRPVQLRYIINKWVDPIFGIAMGATAFFITERREQREPGHTLMELMTNTNKRKD